MEETNPIFPFMNYLFAENISKYYGEKELFSGITLSINKGQRISLVARNGFGKTSLLRIISGEDKPDTGSALLRKELTIGFLEQDAVINEDFTIIETIFDSDNPVVKAVKAYELCLV